MTGGCAVPCRGGDSRARRCTGGTNGPPLKWRRPKACHCEAPKGPWRPERAARGSALGVQSREGSYGFADCFPTMLPGTARLPRRFAPRNDTSGRRSNGNGAAHRIGGTTAASRTGGASPSRRCTGVRDRLSLKWQTPKVCHCEEAKGRRGALSAQREEVPLGCNLAVPGWITGKPSAKLRLPARDCHVASLLAMTHQGARRRERCFLLNQPCYCRSADGPGCPCPYSIPPAGLPCPCICPLSLQRRIFLWI